MRLFCEMTHWFGFLSNPIIASPFFLNQTTYWNMHGLASIIGIALAEQGERGLIQWSLEEIRLDASSESMFKASIQANFMSEADIEIYTLALQVRPNDAFLRAGRCSKEYMLKIDDGNIIDDAETIRKFLVSLP